HKLAYGGNRNARRAGGHRGLAPCQTGSPTMVKFAGGLLGSCFGAAAILALASAPASAHWRHHHQHHHYYYGPLFSYLHNYGPGPVPGTYAYYDGPLR